MKKIFILFTFTSLMLVGFFSNAQITCNTSTGMQATDGGNLSGGTVVPVDLSCATDDILDVQISNFIADDPIWGINNCDWYYDYEISVNGALVAQNFCQGDIEAFDFSQFAPITSIEIQIFDTDFFTDNPFISFDAEITYQAGPPSDNCKLDCPGDKIVYLDPGDCCWPAQYNARTEGDCAINYDTILSQPIPTLGFTAEFDPTNYPEWDPSTTAFGTANDAPFLLNGPGSVATGAALGYNTWSAFDMTNLPDELRLYGRTRYDTPGQCANTGGDGALYNYTMVNFVAPFDGTISFDWDYHTDNGLPYYDQFGYMWGDTWNPFATNISDNFGSVDQNGSYSRSMSTGQSISFYIWGLYDGDCSANVIMSNLVFTADPITDGIVLVDGPAVGDPICDGETQTVKLHLLEHGNVLDSCQFDLTVHQYQNPTTTLACNDNVQISVDDNCVGMVTPDMILEGGPYGCYDNYTVQIFSSMPVNVAGAVGDISNPAPLGTWVVGVYDETGNNCWSTITVLDKIPPTIECACPVGGDFPAGSVAPGSIAGTFSEIDKTAALHSECWDFGTGDQVPDHGDHYYDVYAINVSETGTYAFDGSDGNKMLIGIFDVPFNAVNVCANMIDGMGGYVLGSSGLFYEEPTSVGNLDNTVDLVAGVTYYVVVSDFDADYTGGHSFSITTPQGAEVTFAKTVYADECEIGGCYEDGVDYNFLLPEYADNCSANLTWTQTVREGEDCGTYVVTRHYTVTDGSGLTADCSSEYFFKGIDLANMIWPANFDGLPEHNPMLECDGALPTPDVTGAPSGFNDACGTIEVFYNDQVYDLECGTKILRYWTVVDDCTGGVYEYTQIIRITDTTAPTFMAPEDITAKTKAYVCNSDIEVPAMMHLEDNCDAYPQWWVTTNGGTLVGDLNFNGFVDANETWYILNVPEGEYELCYHAVDNCGNQTDACVTVTVFDGVPPIAVCEQYKQVSLTAMGNAKVWAWDFNSGSFDNCNPVYFKVLRVDSTLVYDGGCEDLNGDDNPFTAANDVWYDDNVYFCCADLDNNDGNVMVSMRVFDVNPGPGPVNPKRMLPGGDLYGHYNDCWSIAHIECKIPPVLDCPPLTVTCEESLDPNENPRLWPNVISVCGAELDYTDNRDMGVCGANIVRTWTAIGCGMPTQCKQRIKVETTEPFDPCTIKFPRDVKADCAKELRDGGEPKWDENPCNVVTAEVINEDTFTFVDGACYKIVREWAVIDWCVYEPNTGAEDNVDAISGTKLNCSQLVEDGYYRYTQILMVTDFIPPTIILEDQCVGTADCYAYDVEMTASATDSCNVDQKFWWKYIVTNMDTWEVVQYSYNYTPRPDQGRKGSRSMDNLDNTATASLVILDPLPKGNYRVIWTVGDGCGNANSTNQYFTVTDKKPPTPVMVDIASAVMVNGMVELKARSFDKGGCDFGCLSSYDNCTDKEGLYFTFTDQIPHLWDNPLKWKKQFNKYGRNFFDPATGAISTESKYLSGTADAWLPAERTAQRAFLCAYVEEGNLTQTIQVYVWDEFALNEDCNDGNYDFANVLLNLNHCEGSSRTVSGLVYGADSNVTMTADDGENKTNIDLANGSYSFNSLSTSVDYDISGATSENDYLNGVTTLDLVIIQKYLLGLKEINDPLKLIAADANGNGDVAASDLLEIRKTILGMSNGFANKSWVLISTDYQFQNIAQAAAEAKAAQIRHIAAGDENITNANFVAVKIGDINGSANALESRNGNSVTMMLDDVTLEAAQEVEVPFYAKDFRNVYGAQFTLNVSNLNVEGITSGAIQVNESNINVVNDNLVMSWNDAKGVNVEDGTVLFTLTLKSNANTNLSNVLNVSDQVLRSEAYTGSDLEINTVKLGYRNSGVSYALYQNEPNPFTEETVIGFDLPEAGAYTLTVYDVTGKVLVVRNAEGTAGYNAEKLSKKDLNANGVLYYRLESGDYTATKKMIVIK